MTERCTNGSLDIDDNDLRALRDDLSRELATPVRFEPTQPLNAYAIAFGESPAASICRRVHALYRARWSRGAEHGHVYVFRDRRDIPATLVKIGSTTHVRRRMAQWRAALNAARDDDITLLFTSETRHVRLAEAVVHALLYCQWDSKRVVRTSQRNAKEYFAVDDWRALRILCAAVTRHIDWWHERGERDPL